MGRQVSKPVTIKKLLQKLQELFEKLTPAEKAQLRRQLAEKKS
jgi:hypothetical protein